MCRYIAENSSVLEKVRFCGLIFCVMHLKFHLCLLGNYLLGTFFIFRESSLMILDDLFLLKQGKYLCGRCHVFKDGMA